MSSYLDSSLLTSLYAPDAHSASAREYLLQAAGPFPLTPFGEAELTNAIELRVFRREITAAQAQAALERLAASEDAMVAEHARWALGKLVEDSTPSPTPRAR